MKLTDIYKNESPVGVCCTCNYGGLEVYEISKGDYFAFDFDFVTAFNYGSGSQSFRRSRVRYTATGRPFIERLGVKYYLDTIMRV